MFLPEAAACAPFSATTGLSKSFTSDSDMPKLPSIFSRMPAGMAFDEPSEESRSLFERDGAAFVPLPSFFLREICCFAAFVKLFSDILVPPSYM